MNQELLTSLVGKDVKVNRGGPESRTGRLLHGGADHFALLTEKDGVVYFNASHVKSISQNSRKEEVAFEDTTEELDYLKEDLFTTLLSSLKYQWVGINRGGPEKLEGVLEDVNEDFVTLVLSEEVVRLATFHIKSISYGVTVNKEEEEKTGKEEK